MASTLADPAQLHEQPETTRTATPSTKRIHYSTSTLSFMHRLEYIIISTIS